MNQNKEALTDKEIQDRYGISHSSLRQGRMNRGRKNRMPPIPYVKIGRKVLYLKKDLDAWFEKHRVQPDLIK